MPEGENKEGELMERKKKFFEDYKIFVDEHKMDFVNYPSFVPDGQGGYKIIVQSTPVDLTNMPVGSPFVPEK